jgi:hypothetical protein
MEIARGIWTDELWLEKLDKNVKARRPAQKEVPFTHALKRLVKVLKSDLKNIGFESIPAEIENMVKRLDKMEGRKPDRLRYPMISKSSAKHSGALALWRTLWRFDPRALEPSFPDAKEMHIGELQGEIETIFEQSLVYRDSDGDRGKGLMTELSNAAMTCEQELFRRLPVKGRPSV